MPHYHIDVWEDESIWSWGGSASSIEEAEEMARQELNSDWNRDYDTWDELAADVNGTALLHDDRADNVALLVEAVRELLDNRSVDYLHSDDREMLKTALFPFEGED